MGITGPDAALGRTAHEKTMGWGRA